MSDPGMMRFLERCRLYLSAAEVRIELGTAEPTDERVVWCPIGVGWRLVVTFDEPPGDPAGALERLEAFADSFTSLGERAQEAAPRLDAGAPHDLDTALEALRAGTGAVRAVVVDGESPVLWGSSDGISGQDEAEFADDLAVLEQRVRSHGLDVVELLSGSPEGAHGRIQGAGLEEATTAALVRETDRLRAHRVDADRAAWRRLVLSARAVAKLRHVEANEAMRAEHGEGFGFLARSIGGIYWLVLVFDGPFSELHTMGMLLRAAPVIESLVASLPPAGPDGGGKVIALPRKG